MVFVANLSEIRIEAIAKKKNFHTSKWRMEAFEIATERNKPWLIALHLSKRAKANLVSERIAVAGARGRP